MKFSTGAGWGGALWSDAPLVAEQATILRAAYEMRTKATGSRVLHIYSGRVCPCDHTTQFLISFFFLLWVQRVA